MICKKCGKELHGLQKCPYCGTSLQTGSYGRIQRSVYWAIMAPCMVVNLLCLNPLLHMEDNPPSSNGLLLLCIVLSIATSVVVIRTCIGRLHDLDKSGWWCLLGLIPYVGTLAVIIIGCKEGTRGPNKYGRDPLGTNRVPAGSASFGHGTEPSVRIVSVSNPKSVPGAGTCQGCGKRLKAGEKFCPQCGMAVPEKKKCQKCGGELDEGQKFCPHCGQSVVEEVPPCQKCGTKLTSGQRFCPKCGTAVEVAPKESKEEAKTAE